MSRLAEFKRAIRLGAMKPLAYQGQEGFGASIAGILKLAALGGRVPDAEILNLFDRRVGVTRQSRDDDDGPAAPPAVVGLVAGPTILPAASKDQKATAIVPMRGIALYDLDWQPYCFSTLLLARTMDQLASDPQIGTIILDVDTPGGSVTGTKEAGDAVWNARKKKRVVALVSPLCASAGYWIASQASEIVAVPSADVGSIGVYMMHIECSKMMEEAGIKPTFIFAGEHKVEGNPYEPLSKDARDWWQRECDTIFKEFNKTVARGRGVTPEEVLENFGQGRCFMAPEAKRLGLIDDVATIDAALTRWGVTLASPDPRQRRMEAGSPAGEDAEQPPAAQDQSSALTVDVAEFRVASAGASVKPAFEVRDVDGQPTIAIRGDLLCDLSASIDKVTFHDCKPMVIYKRADGTYVGGPWPLKSVFKTEVFELAPEITSDGDRVHFGVKNGSAVYTKIDETDSGDWICELQEGSTYEPPPAPADAPAAQDDDAEARQRFAESIRRKLALHSAI